MELTRRKFLKRCGQLLFILGLDNYLPSLAAAAESTLTVKYLRQIITTDPAKSRTIMWQANEELSECRLEYRSTYLPVKSHPVSCKKLTEDNTTNYYYTAELTGLTPAADYEYRILSGSRATTWHHFTTAPATITAFSALIFCDSQCGKDYSVWTHTLTNAWQRHPDAHFFVDIGDLTDNGQLNWHWESFFTAMGSIPEKHLFVPVMGNHECYSLDWKFCRPERYLDSFTLPPNNSSRYQGYYYSYDYGPVHFIVLNTQMLELNEFAPNLLQEQLNWLKQDVHNQQKPWQIVLMHKDVLAYDEYQQGTKQAGGISDVGHAFMKTFEELRIDLVLTGHMHTYRNRGHIHNMQPADQGPVYIMSGPAGNEQYHVPADETYDRSAIYQPTPENYLVLDASTTSLRIKDYTANGELVDTVTLKKESQ